MNLQLLEFEQEKRKLDSLCKITHLRFHLKSSNHCFQSCWSVTYVHLIMRSTLNSCLEITRKNFKTLNVLKILHFCWKAFPPPTTKILRSSQDHFSRSPTKIFLYPYSPNSCYSFKISSQQNLASNHYSFLSHQITFTEDETFQSWASQSISMRAQAADQP